MTICRICIFVVFARLDSCPFIDARQVGFNVYGFTKHQFTANQNNASTDPRDDGTVRQDRIDDCVEYLVFRRNFGGDRFFCFWTKA